MRKLALGTLLLIVGIAVILLDRLPDGHVEQNTLIAGGSFAIFGAFLCETDTMKEALQSIADFVKAIASTLLGRGKEG